MVDSVGPVDGEDVQEPDKVAAGCGLLAGGVFVVVGLLFLYFMMFGSEDDDSSGGGSDVAEIMCQEFVKDRLKSPSSAEFSATTSGLGPQFVVTGTVDSQNSFGAMMQNRFSCTVTEDGDGGWSLVDLSLGD